MKKKTQTTRKRLLSVLLAVGMVLTALPLTAFSALAATSGDFTYWILSEEGKTCCISQYTGSETDVSIPYAIDGYTVTRIGDMESIFTNTPQVESVTIPAGVTEIWFSQDALYSPALRAVNINPENPTFSSVDGVVFSKDKTALYLYPRAKADVTAYEIPYGVEYICVSAFAGCKSLVSITIPDSVTEIGEDAFSGCTLLTTIYGYTDSYAETYANENGYTFVALSSGNKGGDINGDDKINAVDARFVLQAASGLRVLDDTQKAAADVNGDGKINAVDARWILQVASGARTL
ncbi:MAG: leucine-rich repeat protein [Candidatus Fimenecus sp.]